jgi:hypothetical protein
MHGQADATPHLSQIAAAYGAVAASRQRLSPDQLSQAELDLRKAMQSSAGSAALRENVADAARQKTCRLLVCAPSIPAVPAGQVPVSAVLELAVEQFRLEVVKPASSEYAKAGSAACEMMLGLLFVVGKGLRQVPGRSLLRATGQTLETDYGG